MDVDSELKYHEENYLWEETMAANLIIFLKNEEDKYSGQTKIIWPTDTFGIVPGSLALTVSNFK